jgi:ABC-2 type transport system ATP-binding protein
MSRIPIIEVADLELRYGDVVALDHVSFRLDGPRVYGLLGRNGAGKSSLLAVLAAFRKHSGGTVLVDGEPVFENPAATRQICLIRATGDTVERSDRVRDALAFARTWRSGWDEDYAERLVERFDVPLASRIGSLSKGQRCALGITLGLASRAPVTMFDESYLGMDVPSRYAFYDELLADLMAHPRMFVISTHLIEEVSSLFEQVLILDRGTLLVHEEADALRGRGSAVTGPAAAVDAFVDGLTVLSEKRLGGTKSALVYSPFDDDQRAAAVAAGLELGPAALQDLFTHLTEPQGGSE